MPKVRVAYVSAAEGRPRTPATERTYEIVRFKVLTSTKRQAGCTSKNGFGYLNHKLKLGCPGELAALQGKGPTRAGC